MTPTLTAALSSPAGGLLLFSLAGIALLFPFYPLLLLLLVRFRGHPHPMDETDLPEATLLVAVRNGAGLIADKVQNGLALDYPADRLRLVVVSDGSTDGTVELLRDLEKQQPRLTALILTDHPGKAGALNAAFPLCTGEVVVFSDADALLAPEALKNLLRHFADPGVGGVCGQRTIRRDDTDLKEAQTRYIRLDSAIKRLESHLRGITSSDGKLYAIRRLLFRPIPPGVTDDSFTAWSVIGQGYRFLFEPRALAGIRVPSRNAGHELRRRRRIVSRSLRGIRLNHRLLNPFRFGVYAWGLAINKIIRRLLPVLLLGVFIASLALAGQHPLLGLFLLGQVLLIGLAALHPLLFRQSSRPGRLGKLSATAFYFIIGNLGTLLGVFDFLLGRTAVRWDPEKK